MAAKLRATWALRFWPTWPAAVEQALLLDERSVSNEKNLSIVFFCDV